MTASDKTLIIARESGSVQRYALPSAALVNRYQLETRPHHLGVNCNTTLLSVIDVTGLLQFVDLGRYLKKYSDVKCQKWTQYIFTKLEA